LLVLSAALYLAGLELALPQAIAGAMTRFPQHAGAASSFVGVVQQTSAAVFGALVGHMPRERSPVTNMQEPKATLCQIRAA
jgi:DHA1 family bicyclomycin/chloramphenicol resistance-like MFS transporter